MNVGEASSEINELINVTHNEINLARDFVLEYCQSHKREQLKTSTIIREFINQNGLTEPQTLTYSPNEDTTAKLAGAAKYFVHYLACIEVIIALIHNDILFSDSPNAEWSPSLQYKYNNTTSGIRFNECFNIYYPQRVWLAPQYQSEGRAILTDPGLYILTLGIEGADEEVLDAITDAILCFKKGLFRPALTMLGKAMEGAWIELGLSLANAIYAADNPKRTRFISDMEGITPSSQKIRKVIDLYKNRTLSESITNKSEIQPSELDSIFVWSDILRDARNAIHFGVKPTFPNNYEKTAIMLLGAAKHIPKIYHIKYISDTVSP